MILKQLIHFERMKNWQYEIFIVADLKLRKNAVIY